MNKKSRRICKQLKTIQHRVSEKSQPLLAVLYRYSFSIYFNLFIYLFFTGNYNIFP